MITAIVAFYEASRDQTSLPSMTNCSIINVLSLCCSGESKKYNFESAQASLPGGNRGFVSDSVRKREKQEEVKDHSQARLGGDPQCCVAASHPATRTPCARHGFACSPVDSSTPWNTGDHQSNTQIPRNRRNYNIKAHPCDRPPQSRKVTFSSSSTGDWTRGFLCAREAFCHWTLSLAFCVLAQACQ